MEGGVIVGKMRRSGAAGYVNCMSRASFRAASACARYANAG